MMRRALISVYKKDNSILDFVNFLIKNKYEIISTDGTYKYLKNNISSSLIQEISSIISFHEILNGRVKTLHPKIYGGILVDRSDKSQIKSLHTHKISFIDLVVIDVYPFLDKAAQNNNSLNKFVIENIDIGGPSIIRAAAKNFFYVTPVIDRNDYYKVIYEIKKFGFTSLKFRKKLAGKVFNFTSYYDSIISRLFLENEKFPDYFHFPYKKKIYLRYGENPHQKAVLYENSLNRKSIINNFKQLHGKKLSFNNIRDIDIAWKIVSQFTHNTACCIVKHSTPCGVALGINDLEAFKKTYISDSISSFGGIMAINTPISVHLAKNIQKIFLEVIISKNFSKNVLDILKYNKNLRIIEIDNIKLESIESHYIDGGILVQESDTYNSDTYNIVTKKKMSNDEKTSIIFAQKVVKYVKSNAIVIANNTQTLGISGGQTSRIFAIKQAIKQAMKQVKFNRTEKFVLVSDAFFPFRDSIDEIARYKIIYAILQPGGSIRDIESIKACNEHNIAMAFTGIRHFKH